MASRKGRRQVARQRRLAEQQAAAERAARTRRVQLFGGAVAVALLVVAVAIVLSAQVGPSAGAGSAAARTARTHVDGLLAGIPESGNTLGRRSARVTITEYGDLECSVCDVLATPTSFTNPEGERGSGWEDRLITDYVRTGRAKLVYRSLETASSSNPDQNAFAQQQVAAYAAGLQGKAWYYIELFYNEQGHEGTNYVTQSYLDGLARQIPGLNFSRWVADRKLPSLAHEVSADNAAGITAGSGLATTGTPTLIFQGPRGQVHLQAGLPSSYSTIVSAIKSVS